MSNDTDTKRAINWIWVLVVIAVGLLAAEVGWSLRARSTQDRYVLALAEKHEAAARYWDVKTNEILTNNTLERKSNGTKKN